MLIPATTLERLYTRDKYLRLLAAELSIGLPLISMVSVVFLRNPLLGLVPLLTAVVVLSAWIIWESERGKRRAGIFEVTRVGEALILLNMRPRSWLFPAVTLSLTAVECLGEMGSVRYIDYDSRRVGERLLLVLDRKGRVLASSPLSRPVDVDLLVRIG
jgi:hypothetical protein